MKAESRQIPQKLATRLKFAYWFEFMSLRHKKTVTCRYVKICRIYDQPVRRWTVFGIAHFA